MRDTALEDTLFILVTEQSQNKPGWRVFKGCYTVPEDTLT